MSQLFASDGQRTEASASGTSPSNEYSELIPFSIHWFDLSAVQGTLESSLVQKHQFFSAQLSLNGPILTSIHDYWKTHSFDYTELCQQSDASAFKYAV